MLTLFDDVFSPYARKVRIALYEKDVPFQRVRALHGDCNRTDFVDINPRAEVPALVDGSFSLYDSTIICEYLEERYPEPSLHPRDPERRAKCRLVEEIADTQLDAAAYAITVVEFGRGDTHPAMHAAAKRDIERIYGELGALLGDADFFCDEYSLADVAVLPHVIAASFLGFGLDPDRHAHLVGWLTRVSARPAVVKDNQDVLETLGRLQTEKRSAFDPYHVQWRSDRLEWVMKNGFAEWFADEMKSGRAFFPLRLAS